MNGETSHNLHQDFSATLRIFCPDAAGKYTVPVLWDKKENTIVNNESSEIMRMFNRLALLDVSKCQTLAHAFCINS